MKVKRETENTDSQDLRPAEPRESDCRAAWSDVFRALLLQSSYWRTSVIILRNGECPWRRQVPQERRMSLAGQAPPLRIRSHQGSSRRME